MTTESRIKSLPNQTCFEGLESWMDRPDTPIVAENPLLKDLAGLRRLQRIAWVNLESELYGKIERKIRKLYKKF